MNAMVVSAFKRYYVIPIDLASAGAVLRMRIWKNRLSPLPPDSHPHNHYTSFRQTSTMPKVRLNFLSYSIVINLSDL